MVKLKKGQEAFEIVDGPDRGRKFERDVEYEKPPKGYENRFEKAVPAVPVEPKTSGKKGDK